MRTVDADGRAILPMQMGDYAYEGQLSRLVQSIRPLFPDGARFDTRTCYNDFCVLIDWELPGDVVGRPRKSRRINLLFEREVIDDILISLKPVWLRMAETRLRQFIAEKLRLFNPVRDPSTGNIEEEELWVVTAHILGGIG
jgi:hypothetical protein